MREMMRGIQRVLKGKLKNVWLSFRYSFLPECNIGPAVWWSVGVWWVPPLPVEPHHTMRITTPFSTLLLLTEELGSSSMDLSMWKSLNTFFVIKHNAWSRFIDILSFNWPFFFISHLSHCGISLYWLVMVSAPGWEWGLQIPRSEARWTNLETFFHHVANIQGKKNNQLKSKCQAIP